ncbi:anthranilate synthase component II [Taibaiella koreensis]|uniref:anthranilate synthase component II n=1 Tax=Taibaiella koreensis TaxID=1268548 RepID=UPI000E5993A0|nr:aminodeoxychorismate/anthranilate synthase component II [Taibaiella koreensis]
MQILILDNYDSFTYNLALMIYQLSGQRPDVRRNDAITLAEAGRYDKILLSPGPGLPGEAGILCDLIARYAPSKSILGICLGHQAIGQVFGADLRQLGTVCHGIATPVRRLKEDVMLEGLPQPFEVGRYHSWVVAKDRLPDCLEVLAEDEQRDIMALRHRHYDVKGLQFHPESILTREGRRMMQRWLAPPGAIASSLTSTNHLSL